MKTMVHLRDDGIRPYIELEKAEHPLSLEFHEGISMERVQEIVHELEHSEKKKAEQNNPAYALQRG